MSENFRIEKDTMGDVKVPAHGYWGASTQRAVENFPISGQTFPPRFIRALALIKGAAAEVNGELGHLPKKIATLISKAAKRVADGEFDEHFPIDVFQTGSGTSTNTNANEVIANVANLAAGSELALEVARAPERPRELRPVVQRRDPDDDPRRGARGRRPRPAPGTRAAAGVARQEGEGVREASSRPDART